MNYSSVYSCLRGVRSRDPCYIVLESKEERYLVPGCTCAKVTLLVSVKYSIVPSSSGAKTQVVNGKKDASGANRCTRDRWADKSGPRCTEDTSS
jgi:hypothetical protein